MTNKKTKNARVAARKGLITLCLLAVAIQAPAAPSRPRPSGLRLLSAAGGPATNEPLAPTALGEEEDDISSSASNRAPHAPVASGAFRGADGVEFQPVPLDTSVNCSSVILKGTRRFQGTAFVLPRVLVSMNKQQETLFEIIQTDTDRYLLRFAIYFPRTDEDLEVRVEKSHVQLHGCHFDAVLAELNKGIREEERRIKTLARIPVSSIDVRIDGVRDAYTLSGTEGSMLNYNGTDHVVEFPVASRRELEAIMARIQGEIGLGIHVALKFNARSADGAMFADVDLRALAASLGGALGARRTIAAGDLQMVIGQQLKKMSINIETEAGSGDVYTNLASQITELITAAVMTDGELQPRQNDGIIFDPMGGDPDVPGQGTMRERPRAPQVPQLDTGQTIRVSAALDVLRRRSRMRVSYQNVGASEQHVYTTSVLFKGEVSDPDVRTVNVYSGESSGRVLPNRLVRDNPIAISAVARIPEQISYSARTRYFSQKQLLALRMHEKFPILRDEKLKIEDRTLKDGLVGIMRKKQGWNPFTDDYYLWGVSELSPSVKQLTTREIELSQEVLKTVPIVVSFSKVGARKFRLHELLGDNRLWGGQWDDIGGKVILTPKSNLGQMTIWNVEPILTREMVKRWYVQEHRDPHRTFKVEKVTDVKGPMAVARSVIKVQVSEDSEVVGSIRPTIFGDELKGVLSPRPR